MDLEKLARALGIDESEIENCAIQYYSEWGLTKKEADVRKNKRLQEKILRRIEELVSKVEDKK